MKHLPIHNYSIVMFVIALTATLATQPPARVYAQDDNNNDTNNNTDDSGNTTNNNNQNNGGANGGNNNNFSSFPAGIRIDAAGVVQRHAAFGDGLLQRKRLAAAFSARRQNDAFEPSKLRMVSLTRLESVAEECLMAGKDVPTEMRFLAGLTRVEYVFLYPAEGEIVIAGPAAGWVDLGDGNVLSLESEQPVLRLEDLAVALRVFRPEGRRKSVIACSIDPTRAGLAKMQAFLASISSRPPSSETIVEGLKNALGLQRVSIKGVAASTRFAQVMVAADYRMKLIGIGLEQPSVRIASYVKLARPIGRQNALARWYFMPDYDRIAVDDQELTMKLEGQGVKLVSQAELVATDGQRHQSPRRDGASERFTKGFTEMYPQLAARSPIFAELRNLMDISVVAAFLQRFDAYGRCNWSPSLLTDESRFAVETRSIPKQVGTAATAVWKGSRLMTPVGGGVHIQPSKLLARGNLVSDHDRHLYGKHGSISFEELRDDQWWWD